MFQVFIQLGESLSSTEFRLCIQSDVTSFAIKYLTENQSINKDVPTFGHQTQYGVSLVQGMAAHTGSGVPVVSIQLHHVHWVSVRTVLSSTVPVCTGMLRAMPRALLLDPQAVQAR